MRVKREREREIEWVSECVRVRSDRILVDCSQELQETTYNNNYNGRGDPAVMRQKTATNQTRGRRPRSGNAAGKQQTGPPPQTQRRTRINAIGP